MEEEFSYEIFDRQMENLLGMSHVLIQGWNDYSTQEMTFDIRSLGIKAARLCYMADLDRALQQEDLMHLRREKNRSYYTQLRALVHEELSPLMLTVADALHQGMKLEGCKHPLFPKELGQLLPRLTDQLNTDAAPQNDMILVSQRYAELEKLVHKNLKPTKMPGIKSPERFWNMIQYYALMCYLLAHFQHVVQLCQDGTSEEDVGRILQATIHRYCASDAGRMELERYWTTLVFDNRGKELTLPQLEEAWRNLRQAVPERLQLTYMQHFLDLQTLATTLLAQNPSTQEFHAMIDVLAKGQLLQEKMHQLKHPEEIEDDLDNQVFCRTLDSHPVSMTRIREMIEQMLPLVEHKNDWFCIWCVLRHHNLLATQEMEAFANQMMQPDWFGKESSRIHFTGDTLREYKGYLTSTDYTAWKVQDYENYRTMHNKTKWSSNLCNRFQHLCYEMEERLEG